MPCPCDLFRDGRFDLLGDLLYEPIFSESGRVGDGTIRVPFPVLEPLDRLDEGVRGLIVEKDTGLAFDDRFECAAVAVGDDGATGGLGLDGGHPEVLGGGKDQGVAAPEEVD